MTENRHQYLLIHKSGCRFIRNCLTNSTWSGKREEGIPSWTVLRDPYERFISGLSYDILNTNPNLEFTKENIIEYITNNDIINGVNTTVSEIFRNNDTVIHYISQATYYMGENIDYFIKLEDLDEFSKYNFLECDLSCRNEVGKNYKHILEDAIKSVPDLKTRIDDILRIDYYMIEKIEQAGKFWKWQYGKVL